MRSLFITYDGLLSPLGQSQILPYLRGLSRKGHTISILSFEHGPHAARCAQAPLRAEFAAEGIHWVPLTYHKRPSVPATAFDILQGTLATLWLIRRDRIEVLHARSYLPALMALLAKGKRQKFIFDMRGLWADERYDGKIWNPEKRLYRLMYDLAKKLERWALRRADHVVTLTRASLPVLQTLTSPGHPLPPTSVIPTAVDLERFQPAHDKMALRQELGLPLDRRILVYQGSIGTWYMVDEMVDFVRHAKERWPDLLWLILTHSEPDTIRGKCTAAGLVEGPDFQLRALQHKEVGKWVSTADAALFFIRSCFSKQASCPTKFGECLACGVPVIANGGVGDVAETLTTHPVGALVEAFTSEAYDRALDEVEQRMAEAEATGRACRETAEAEFALMEAVVRYDRLYRSLSSGSQNESARSGLMAVD